MSKDIEKKVTDLIQYARDKQESYLAKQTGQHSPHIEINGTGHITFGGDIKVIHGGDFKAELSSYEDKYNAIYNLLSLMSSEERKNLLKDIGKSLK